MTMHAIDPTPITLMSSPPLDVWPCLTCGLLVIDPEIHQDWSGDRDLSDLENPELHEKIAEQRGVSATSTDVE